MDNEIGNLRPVVKQSLSSQGTVPQKGTPRVSANEIPKPAGGGQDTTTVREVRDQEELQRAIEDSVDRLQSAVQSIQRDLKFSVDDVSGDTVITVLDSETEEVVRQIPSEEAIALAKNLESIKGVLFSAEV